MRLDAALGHRARVWHCRELRQVVFNVLWADDELHKYAVIAGIDRARGEVIPFVTQAERIVICANRSLVLIDPREDEDEQSIATPDVRERTT